jgi:hypothetical protein
MDDEWIFTSIRTSDADTYIEPRGRCVVAFRQKLAFDSGGATTCGRYLNWLRPMTNGQQKNRFLADYFASRAARVPQRAIGTDYGVYAEMSPERLMPFRWF